MERRLHDRIDVTSELDRVPEVRHWCADQAVRAALDAEAVGDVELAVTEALANVIRHSYEGRGGHPIAVEAIVGVGRLELHVVDEGIPFDPDAYGGVDLDEAHEHGYGVFMIDALMDDVRRCSGPNGGTELVLVKFANSMARSS
jgi:serine/threonine-protein kinase RsbW